MSIRRAFALFAVLLLIAGTASIARPPHPDEIRGVSTEAVKPGPEGITPVRGDVAVLSLLSDIDSLNPFTSSSGDASEIHDLIYPRLMIEQPDYYKGPPSFEPNIAESWEYGEDGLSMHFTLRDCVWSDGKPITSEDVRFSWQAARHPDVAWVSASIVDFITDIEVVSPRRFTVRYSKSYPYQQMDINDIQILPKHTFGKVPFEQWQTHGVWTEQAKASGGPFVFESSEPNQSIVLVRNERYWDEGKPYLDKVVFRVIPDQRQQLTSMLAGDTDAMRGVDPKDAKHVLDADHLELYTYVTRSYGYVGWNCKRWPFDDARVRNAMTHAIDIENIVESLLRGYGKQAAPHIISSLWASNDAIEPLEYDPDRAEELLQEAGWVRNEDDVYEKDGKAFQFNLVTNSGNAVRKKICEMLEADMREIGVRAKINPMDFNQMSSQLKRHEFQAYVGGWYVATKVDMKAIWHSTAAQGRFNYVSYGDPRVDEIIETARLMSDFEAAKPLWDELQEILHRDQPYTMLYEPRGLVGIHKRFQNVKVNSLRALANIHEWWVPVDQRRFE